MSKTEIFDSYVEDYEAWYDQYPEVYESELAALREQFTTLPEDIRGIEVGVGTGRFAQPLGIKEGIEPSEEMAKKAIRRKIEILKGVAESLPYGDLQFDFVLFVTICHLDNIKRALQEAHRVLKPNGAILIGFLDKDQIIAQEYIEKRERSTFFRQATFYSVDYLQKVLKETGFINPVFNQTLFGALEAIKEVQYPKPGYGKGSFVVLKAIKK